MNKVQRKRLGSEVIDVLTELTDVEALKGMTYEEIDSKLAGAKITLDEVASEEREKFDNMSEGLQAGPTGQKLSDAADGLEGVTWPSPDEDDLKKAIKEEDEDALQAFADECQTALDEVDSVCSA